MFTSKSKAEKSQLDRAIDDLFAQMAIVDGDSEEYATMVTQMDTLYKLKEVDANVETKSRISKDTLVIVGGNLLGIIMIVGHERAHVIGTKAMAFMLKLR